MNPIFGHPSSDHEPLTEQYNKGRRITEQYNKDHRLTNESGDYTRVGKMNIVSNVMLVALLIIGIVAATGGIPAAAAGWTAVGLGGGALMAQLLGGDLKKRKVDVILSTLLAAGIIAMGALGGAGVLTRAQLGYSLIGITGANAILWCVCCHALAARKVNLEEYHNLSNLTQFT
ncbi:MAG: hypothetical protein JJU12_05895 [Chlamydiales bacterium]|nr:hypothetical protein [Chlamydiales bacterium]